MERTYDNKIGYHFERDTQKSKMLKTPFSTYRKEARKTVFDPQKFLSNRSLVKTLDIPSGNPTKITMAL